MANKGEIRRCGGVNRRTAEHHERISRHSGRNEAIIALQLEMLRLPARCTGLQHVDDIGADRKDFAVG